MLVNKTLYSGVPGTVLGRFGTTILGTNKVIKTQADPATITPAVPFLCEHGERVRWKLVEAAFLPATTVCLLETEKRMRP
jgi:hypothetical protein